MGLFFYYISAMSVFTKKKLQSIGNNLTFCIFEYYGRITATIFFGCIHIYLCKYQGT